MSLISSMFGADFEWRDLYNTGIARAILGSSNGKFRMPQNWVNPNQKVLLVDTSFNNLLWIAQNVPHLNVVITKFAQMASNGKIRHVDKDGNDIENSDIIKLFSSPNPLTDSPNAFVYDCAINYCIYQSIFCYANQGSKLLPPSALWWLPSGSITIELTGKIYRQIKLSDIITGFKVFNYTEPFATDEVIFMTEGVVSNGIIAGTTIQALQIPLSNIIAALKTDNVLLCDMGARGILSGNGEKDSEGYLPPDSGEKKRLEEAYGEDYGLDTKRKVIITGAQLKFQSMVFDAKALMLHEGLEDAFGLICGAYGLDRAIFPTSFLITRGLTTGTEIQSALKATYQNTIQPFTDKVMNMFAKRFGLLERGERLYIDFTELPCMQEDRLSSAQADYAEAQRLSLMKKDGIIDAKSYAEIAEVEFTGTGVSETQTMASESIKASTQVVK